MANLLDLPEELILLIVRFLVFDNLTNLAVVCKHLTDPARFGLMRRVIMSVGQSENQQRPKHLIGFRDLLRKHPHLVDAIKWLELDWEYKRLLPVYHEVLKLVSSSISMQRLSIQLLKQTQISKLPILFDYPPGAFSKLEEIDIGVEDDDLSAIHMARLCEFPKLKAINCDVSSIVACSEKTMQEYKEQTAKSARLPLRRLSATGYLVHLDLLRLILPRTKTLSEINISLPSPGVQISLRSLPLLSADGFFSPATIGECLLPVARSLESLSISTMTMWQYNNVFTRVPPWIHNNSVLDLSSFHKISYLRLSSYLLFGNSISADEADEDFKRNISKVLPPNIERLIINFEGSQGIYINLEDLYKSFFDSPTYAFLKDWEMNLSRLFFLPDHLSWLYNIVSMKSQGHFPNLKSITLEECWSNEWENWELFDLAELHSKLTESGVAIRILVMVPAPIAARCCHALSRQGFRGGIDRSHALRLQKALSSIYHADADYVLSLGNQRMMSV